MKTKTISKAHRRSVTLRVKTPVRSQRQSVRCPAGLNIKSILVPIDFAEPSKKALEYAVAVAEQFGAQVNLLHVVEPIPAPDFANSFPLMMESDKVIAACKGRLQLLVKQQAIDPDLVDRTVVSEGRAYNEIVKSAGNLKVDLIIIATHGYTGIKHAVLGSTAERVVRHASCPVLVIR